MKRIEQKPVHDGRTLDENYLPPEAALHKLARAREQGQTVYLHGVMGTGKTSLMTYFLKDHAFAYYSAIRAEAADLLAELHASSPFAVVIDDLEVLTEDRREAFYLAVERLIRRKDVWLVLISRSMMPRWLAPLYVYYPFVEIGEKDLVFSEERQREYLARQGIKISRGENAQLQTLIMGNPLALRLAVRDILKNADKNAADKRGKLLDQEMIDRLENAFGDLMAHWACRWWPEALLAFLMKLSVVADFTLPMAQIITESDQAGAYLLECQEYGGFIRSFRRYHEVRYQIYEPFRQFLEKQLKLKNTTRAVAAVYRRASLGYEQAGDLIKAVEMAAQSDDKGRLRQLLIANAASSVRLSDFWQLRRHYLALPEATIRTRVSLMAAMSVIEALAFHDEASEAWYRELQTASQTASPAERQLARERIIFLDVTLPTHSSTQMIDQLLKWENVKDISDQLGVNPVIERISLCGETPSIMNGLRDFCDWIRENRQDPRLKSPDIDRIFGQFGKGVRVLAEVESQFERGESNRQMGMIIQRGLVFSDAENKLPYVFVAVTLMAQQYMLDNAAAEALSLVEGLLERTVDEAPELTAGVEAVAVRLMLYQGWNPRIASWLDRENNNETVFNSLDAFYYLAKVRVYLARGWMKKAQSLLQRLLVFARRRRRVCLGIEVTVLMAITLYRLGESAWKTLLQETITEAEAYHLVRILTREGPVLAPLFHKGRFLWRDAGFKKQVLAESRRMAELYPDYLKDRHEAPVHLSEMALTILKYQAEGLTAKEIGEAVGLSEAGVKYYNKETYQKLGVHNKTEAVMAARNRKLI
jgi:LuxR family maltose regulon positive regulatory protein